MDGANRIRVRHGACAVPSIGLCDCGHVQGVSPAVWRDERKRTRSRAVAAGETPNRSEWYQREGTAPRTITTIMDQ
ncbi:MAG: hypothetical protein JSR31_17325 [Nitrospira sp.]|nr:hypothetical protein [Nitrospira sp.]